VACWLAEQCLYSSRSRSKNGGLVGVPCDFDVHSTFPLSSFFSPFFFSFPFVSYLFTYIFLKGDATLIDCFSLLGAMFSPQATCYRTFITTRALIHIVLFPQCCSYRTIFSGVPPPYYVPTPNFDLVTNICSLIASVD